ncbi:MAG: hypothetical protein NZL95_05525 [Chitinophagales bacterium]|nr:hypothetical protein [Chitinophagales bacterium]MDW8427993.1 hypothetical protein [Chitinophagales bacterium]
MGEILFILLTLYFLYRSYAAMQKAARKEAEERRRRNEEIGRRLAEQQRTPTLSRSEPLPTAPEPTSAPTLDDILRELLGEEERPAPPRPRSKKPRPAPAEVTPATRPEPKKTEPFLTTDFHPELKPEPTKLLDVPAPETAETLLQPTPTPIAALKATRPRYAFNLRQAIIAKTILDRPEW